MIVVTDSHKLLYELGNVARLFFPAEEVSSLPEGEPLPPDQAAVLCREQGQDGRLHLTVELLLPGQQPRSSAVTLLPEESAGYAMEYGKLLYRILADYTGRTIDWGVLTGIRPVKLARNLRLGGKTLAQVERHFVEGFLTTPQKAALCALTDQIQRPVIESALPGGYSLYISIPFCPSRCSYCSFVSHSTEKSLAMIPDYLDKLCQELEETARLANQRGMTLQTAYMGGGTPTVLTAPQLEQVLATVRRCFRFDRCTEFTVEAGRPDTITADKLEVLRRYGVDRISVNCQTLNDRVLEQIGRRHTAAQFLEAYQLVRRYDFTAVNVDLIAGLPGDDLASFEASLQGVLALKPENITVHSLTVKRAARLAEEKQTILQPGNQQSQEVAAMVSYSQRQLAACGYQPYYLYRQKGTVDCLENVGFALPGKSCAYNIFIMDETHTILSTGGGGVTKLVAPPSAQQTRGETEPPIVRLFNYKYPYEYLQRFDTMMEKKQAILDFPLQ